MPDISSSAATRRAFAKKYQQLQTFLNSKEGTEHDHNASPYETYVRDVSKVAPGQMNDALFTVVSVGDNATSTSSKTEKITLGKETTLRKELHFRPLEDGWIEGLETLDIEGNGKLDRLERVAFRADDI